jgi:hypothetical protein
MLGRGRLPAAPIAESAGDAEMPGVAVERAGSIIWPAKLYFLRLASNPGSTLKSKRCFNRSPLFVRSNRCPAITNLTFFRNPYH